MSKFPLCNLTFVSDSILYVFKILIQTKYNCTQGYGLNLFVLVAKHVSAIQKMLISNVDKILLDFLGHHLLCTKQILISISEYDIAHTLNQFLIYQNFVFQAIKILKYFWKKGIYFSFMHSPFMYHQHPYYFSPTCFGFYPPTRT